MEIRCERLMRDHDLISRNARYGYCFRVMSRFNNEVNAIPDASVLQVLKNGIYFTIDGSEFESKNRLIFSDLRSASSEYEECKTEYNSAQQSLVEKITEVALTYVPLFNIFSSLVAQLDVLTSFAAISAAAAIPYTRPHFLDITQSNRWDRWGVITRRAHQGGASSAAGDSVRDSVYSERL